jgi:hypothetical protein
MLITPVLVLLLVLLFYKRPVNNAGVGWTPPPRTLWQDPPPAQPGAQSEAPAEPQAATAGEVPMDFNDLFGGRKGPPNQPRA